MPYPPQFLAGLYWYGNRRARPGRPPKWVEKLLRGQQDVAELSGEEPDPSPDTADEEEEESTDLDESAEEKDEQPRVGL